MFQTSQPENPREGAELPVQDSGETEVQPVNPDLYKNQAVKLTEVANQNAEALNPHAEINDLIRKQLDFNNIENPVEQETIFNFVMKNGKIIGANTVYVVSAEFDADKNIMVKPGVKVTLTGNNMNITPYGSQEDVEAHYDGGSRNVKK